MPPTLPWSLRLLRRQLRTWQPMSPTLPKGMQNNNQTFFLSSLVDCFGGSVGLVVEPSPETYVLLVVSEMRIAPSCRLALLAPWQKEEGNAKQQSNTMLSLWLIVLGRLLLRTAAARIRSSSGTHVRTDVATTHKNRYPQQRRMLFPLFFFTSPLCSSIAELSLHCRQEKYFGGSADGVCAAVVGRPRR